MPVIKNVENRFCHSPWLFQPWLDLTSLNFRCYSLSFWSLKILGKINEAMNTAFSLSHRRVLSYRLQGSLVLFLGQWFSKCEPRTSSISISWGLVRNSNSWDLLQSHHQIGGGAQQCPFTSPPCDADTHDSTRPTVQANPWYPEMARTGAGVSFLSSAEMIPYVTFRTSFCSLELLRSFWWTLFLAYERWILPSCLACARIPHVFPTAAVTNQHELCGLNQHKFIIL